MRINNSVWHYKMYVKSFGGKKVPGQTDICSYVSRVVAACWGSFWKMVFLSITNFFSVVVLGYGTAHSNPKFDPKYDTPSGEDSKHFIFRQFPVTYSIAGRKVHISIFVRCFWAAAFVVVAALLSSWGNVFLATGLLLAGLVAFLIFGATIVGAIVLGILLLEKLFGGAGVAFEFLKAKANGYCTVITFDEERT